eukprot:Awhi_evm1s13977
MIESLLSEDQLQTIWQIDEGSTFEILKKEFSNFDSVKNDLAAQKSIATNF